MVIHRFTYLTLETLFTVNCTKKEMKQFGTKKEKVKSAVRVPKARFLL